MTNVCARAAATSSVVAARPTIRELPAREVPDVGDDGGRVEAEGNEVRVDVHVLGRRREVALLGPRRRASAARPARPGGARRRRAAGSSRCSRRCTGSRARRRSARRRRRDPTASPGRRRARRSPAPAAACTNSASRKPLRLRLVLHRGAPIGVDRRLRALRQIEHLLEGEEARRVLAVGEQHDRLPAHLVAVARRRPSSGPSARCRCALYSEVDPPADVWRMACSRSGRLAGERLADLDAAVEVDRPRARSCGRRRRAKPMAASCERRQLGLPCSRWCRASSESAIGMFVRLKKVTSCFTPSSNTLKSAASRPVT